ncbi:unnamed protein product [Scytosiphon promiscuus]
MNGVNPPSEILSYLQNEEFESELYDEIFGERDRLAGKEEQRSKGRNRKYGTHALAAHLIGGGGGRGGGGGATATASAAPGVGGRAGGSGPGAGGKEGVGTEGGTGGDGPSSRLGGGKGAGGGKKGDAAKQREQQTFAEAVRDSLKRADERRTKMEQDVEEDGGAFPGNPRHPVGWVGTFTETFTHAERKEEALKRRAGEARSRERRLKRQEAERLAAVAAAGGAGGQASPGGGPGGAVIVGDGDKTNAIPRSIDKPKGGFDGAAENTKGANGGGVNRRGRGGALSAHRRRGGGGGGGAGTRLEPRRKPILVKTGGGGSGGQGSLSEEPSPALDAVVAGLRRKGSNSKWRSRRGSGMSAVPSQPSVRRKEGGAGAGGGTGGGGSGGGGKVSGKGRGVGKAGGGGGGRGGGGSKAKGP